MGRVMCNARALQLMIDSAWICSWPKFDPYLPLCVTGDSAIMRFALKAILFGLVCFLAASGAVQARHLQASTGRKLNGIGLGEIFIILHLGSPLLEGLFGNIGGLSGQVVPKFVSYSLSWPSATAPSTCSLNLKKAGCICDHLLEYGLLAS